MITRVQVNPFFTPTQISGCALWLDAADTRTLTLSGSSVAEWRDKSGNRNNATNTGTVSYTTASLNNLNVVSFTSATATNNVMVTSSFSINPIINSFFVVLQFGATPSGGTTILGSTHPTNGAFTHDIVVGGTTTLSFSIGQVNVGTLFSSSTYTHPISLASQGVIFHFKRTDASTVEFRINGTLLTSTSVNTNSFVTSTGYLLGANLSGTSMGEHLIYRSALSTTETQQVEGYLAWKWGLQESLPATHPYKRSIIPPLLNQPSNLPTARQSPPFTPLQIPGCSLWLDAADSSTVSLSGANLTQWRDKSGLTNNASVAAGSVTYASQPRSLVFNGSSYLTLPSNTFPTGNTNYSLFIISSSGLANYYWIVAAGIAVAGQVIGCVYYPDGIIESGWWTANIQTPIGSVQPNAITMIECIYSSPTLSTLINGTSLASSSSLGTRNNPSGPNIIGARPESNPGSVIQGLVGSINEILVFGGLSTTQRQQIESYLARKWGLVGSLPANHPFKLWPPV